MAFLIAAVIMLAPFLVLYLAGTGEEQPAGSAEGAAVRRLLAGDLDRDAYRAVMAELAVRDDRDRPLHVPGEPSG